MAIPTGSNYTRYRSLEAILNFYCRFDVKGLLDPKNIGLNVEIAFLFCLQAEI